MAYTLNGKTACRYCGREGKVSAILPGIAWQLKKSEHLAYATIGVPPSSPLAVGAGQTGEIITTTGWSVIDDDVED